MKLFLVFFCLSFVLPISSLPTSPNDGDLQLQHPLSVINNSPISAFPSDSRSDSETTLRITHGTFITHARDNNRNGHTHTHTLRTAQSPFRWLDRYADELFAAGIFLLVPIALAIVEVAERLARRLSVEEFPDRGRETHRCMTAEERQKSLLARQEREKKAQNCWWKTTRETRN
ncbi:hypothetical protein AOCH_005829 [Aspergillus ochraceoroseus]|uniref:Uncharacterized protein n=1 Tax=Aspergillus ochraceoroseus TaxID=138278 RepID=A0A0F8XLL6_9EURO|nr:hypothetical protein AOCH_005829 [Aspergillus ochraceoroseus]